jgi:hypothetical protein
MYPEGWRIRDENPTITSPIRNMNRPMAGVPLEVGENEIEALDVLAKDTGGIVARNVDEVVNLVDDIANDFDQYYSLAYRVPPTGRDRRRAISVRLKNHPEYIVRARNSFVEKSDDTRMKNRVVAHLFGPPAASVIPVDVALGEVRQTAKNRWAIPVKVWIPVSSLSVADAGSERKGKFSVYFAWGGALGEIGDAIHKTQTFTIPAAKYEDARSTHFTYEMELNADAATSKLSVAVVDDATGDAGYRVLNLPRRTAN